MKAIIYARVSSKEQGQEGYSIPSQLKLLNEHASKNNYKVIKEFVDVETAKQAGREKFCLMIEFLKKNPDVRTVLCEKTDRLSRNFRDIATLDDLTRQSDLNIILVKENTTIGKNSSSSEKFMFGIKALMAKNYIDNLSEETRKGLTEKAEQGLYPALAPLGYKNSEGKQNGRVLKYLEIDDQRAPIIQKVFRLYATGNYSLEMITELAYKEGLRNRDGARVAKATLHKTLHNPIYYGSFIWGGKLYPGSHTPLVSKELFEAVQDAFNPHNKPKQTKKQFAYSGLMACGKCGCAITAEIQKGKYVYYHCTGFKGKCTDKYIREEELTKQFADIVKKIHINDDTLSVIKQALLDSHKDEIEFHKIRIEILNTQKTKLENRLHQIYVDKIDAKISEEFFNKTTDKWQEELNEIKSAIVKHENADSNYLAQGVHILELCNQAYRLYLQQTALENAKLLRYILSNCTLNDGTLCATYRKPFHLLAEGLHRQDWGE